MIRSFLRRLTVVYLVLCIPGFGTIANECSAATPNKSNAPDRTKVTGPFNASTVTSHGGEFRAYFSSEQPTVLYLQNVRTKESKALLKSADLHVDWDVVNDLSFSPDDSTLMFLGGPARPYTATLYAVQVDSGKVTEIAQDIQAGQPESGSPSGKSNKNIGITNPIVSPDSKTVAFTMRTTNSSRAKDRGRHDSSEALQVAVVPINKKTEKPQGLAEGRPLFWSTDTSSLYYVGTDMQFHNIDLQSKQVSTVGDASKVSIFGRVPGQNAIFVQQSGSAKNPITILSLDGTSVSDELQKAVAGISPVDSSGGKLVRVEGVDSHTLTVKYKNPFNVQAEPSSTDAGQVIKY